MVELGDLDLARSNGSLTHGKLAKKKDFNYVATIDLRRLNHPFITAVGEGLGNGYEDASAERRRAGV
jgi:hypothetical protein